MGRFAIGAAIGVLCVACGDNTRPAPAGIATNEFTESAVNRAPVIESVWLDPAEPAQGAVIHAVVTARDPDGQPVTIAHRWFVDGSEQQVTDGTLTLESVAKGSEIRVSVTASDGSLASDARDASARVIDRPPQLGQVVIVPASSVAPGQPVSASAMASDPDGDPVDLEYEWYVNGERRDVNGSVFVTDGLVHGDTIYAEVRARDASNRTDPQRTAVVTVGSSHPKITSTPPGFRENGEFRYQVVAVDPDGDRRLRYALEKGPEGMAIDDVLGELVWRPRDNQSGVHPVTVVVRDSSGLETKQSFSVTVKQGEKKSDAGTAVPAAPAPDASATPKHQRPPIEERIH
jgi:hypothetical protein